MPCWSAEARERVQIPGEAAGTIVRRKHTVQVAIRRESQALYAGLQKGKCLLSHASSTMIHKTILFSVTDSDGFRIYWAPTKCQILYAGTGPM